MTNHPNRSKPNLILIEDGRAFIARVIEGRVVSEIETCALHVGRYVRINDGNSYPQLCVGAARLGNTLEYYSDEQLARGCRAKLYKTRAGYDAAKSRLAQ